MKVTMYDKLLLLPLFQGLGIQELTSIIEKAKFHFLKFQTGNTVAPLYCSCWKDRCIVKRRTTRRDIR